MTAYNHGYKYYLTYGKQPWNILGASNPFPSKSQQWEDWFSGYLSASQDAVTVMRHAGAL